MENKVFDNQETNYLQEDEIDLKELFKTILKYKYKILIFVFIITSLTIVYTMSIPNSYTSKTVLSPQTEQKSISGGLSSLASIAGVNLGGSSSKDPSIMLETTLKDYEFNKMLIEKYDLTEKLKNQSNLVFAFGIDTIYKLFNSTSTKKDNRTNEEKIYETINLLNSSVSLSTDKNSNLITLSVELQDRVLAKKIVDIYLDELIKKIKKQDMKEIDKQIKYYKKELSDTLDVSLKEQLSKSLSSLYQKKVFSQANDYYFVSKIIDSRVPYIKEKSKPKRALIVIVSFVTSFIIGIFLVFFREFLKNEKSN
ncbi:MAG: Wzz/FepE/Etk N-terminal domain-containing protein [Campylobacterota bacterium]